jgi:hypothetical protein
MTFLETLKAKSRRKITRKQKRKGSSKIRNKKCRCRQGSKDFQAFIPQN